MGRLMAGVKENGRVAKRAGGKDFGMAVKRAFATVGYWAASPVVW